MRKKVWVLSTESTDLSSVQTIARNWSHLYQDLGPEHFDVCVFNINSYGEFPHYREKLLEYKNFPPEYVVVVHHTMIDNIFFRSLLLLNYKMTTFIFHVVGNFIRYGENWARLSRLLINKRVQFVTASKCYYELLSNFIDKEHLSIAPFPLATAPRGKRSLDGKKLRIIYAGRYHEQKNVTEALLLLSDYAEEEKVYIEIKLATYFDDFNPTTIDEFHLLGHQFSQFKKALEKCSPFLSVEFLAYQSAEKLNQLMADSDLFISLSTFFDEDFGFAVGEALLQGTPCVLSKWGGYKDFCLTFPEGCFGLEINIRENDLYMNVEDLKKYIEKALTLKEEERLFLRQKSIDHLGADKSKKTIQKIMKREKVFNGSMGTLMGFSRELRKKNSSSFFTSFYRSFWSEE